MSTITTILTGEAGVAGVQQLMAPDAVRPLIQQMMERPEQLRACHLRRAKFKPGRKITAYYDAVVAEVHPQSPAGLGKETTYPLAITWTHPDEPLKLATTEGPQGQEIRERGLATPFCQQLAYQPAQHLHIQLSPFDPVFPQLVRLSDPAYLRDRLGEYATGSSEWQVTPIRYRPRQRHVLRFDAARQEKEHDGAPAMPSIQTFFAKIYADDSPQALYTRTNRLADWLDEHQENAAILRPLAYLAPEQTLLFAEAAGDPLSASLANGEGGPSAYVLQRLYQTGVALRHLQQAPAALCDLLPPLTIGAECKAITRTCEQIQALLPATWQHIAALLACTQEQYERLPTEAPTLVHGDFKADHVLVHGERITFFDLDSCALADPAYDVGKFLADLGWFYGGTEGTAYRAAAGAFLAGYGLPVSHPRVERAGLWQTLIGVKIVAHRVRIFEGDWAERVVGGVRGIEEGCTYEIVNL